MRHPAACNDAAWQAGQTRRCIAACAWDSQAGSADGGSSGSSRRARQPGWRTCGVRWHGPPAGGRGWSGQAVKQAPGPSPAGGPAGGSAWHVAAPQAAPLRCQPPLCLQKRCNALQAGPPTSWPSTNPSASCRPSTALISPEWTKTMPPGRQHAFTSDRWMASTAGAGREGVWCSAQQHPRWRDSSLLRLATWMQVPPFLRRLPRPSCASHLSQIGMKRGT